jgi:hypothetical protein
MLALFDSIEDGPEFQVLKPRPSVTKAPPPWPRRSLFSL